MQRRRVRQRYLDLLANERVMENARARSKVASSVRRFMEARGFMEVETPILVPVAAGGFAEPFETYHNALGRGLFLRNRDGVVSEAADRGWNGQGFRNRARYSATKVLTLITIRSSRRWRVTRRMRTTTM